jgi:ribosomal 50S subunit-recycling heat shock protein
VTGPGLVWAATKLKCAQAGLYAVGVSFYLSRAVSQGAIGRGHVWVNGKSVLSAALTDVNGRATASLSWNGTLNAGDIIDAAFQNDSSQVQDEQGGSIVASSA